MNEFRASLLALLLLSLSTAELAADQVAEQVAEQMSVSPLSIEVILSEKILNVRLGEQLIRSYPIAIGTIDHPTPEGEFLIEKMIWNPWWYPPHSEWARGLSPTPPGDRSNPMRVVKIPFDPPFYYIHGTDRPQSLGTMASHGCVRVSEETAAELGRLVMQFGGIDRSDGWYRQLSREKKEREVTLDLPVSITVRMGDENVYPGVVWAVD